MLRGEAGSENVWLRTGFSLGTLQCVLMEEIISSFGGKQKVWTFLRPSTQQVSIRMRDDTRMSKVDSSCREGRPGFPRGRTASFVRQNSLPDLLF